MQMGQPYTGHFNARILRCTVFYQQKSNVYVCWYICPKGDFQIESIEDLKYVTASSGVLTYTIELIYVYEEKLAITQIQFNPIPPKGHASAEWSTTYDYLKDTKMVCCIQYV